LVELPSAADPHGLSFPSIGRCPPFEVLVGPQEVVPGEEAGDFDLEVVELVAAIGG
jgi:hypothetical protein